MCSDDGCGSSVHSRSEDAGPSKLRVNRDAGATPLGNPTTACSSAQAASPTVERRTSAAQAAVILRRPAARLPFEFAHGKKSCPDKAQAPTELVAPRLRWRLCV